MPLQGYILYYFAPSYKSFFTFFRKFTISIKKTETAGGSMVALPMLFGFWFVFTVSRIFRKQLLSGKSGKPCEIAKEKAKIS